MYYFYWFMGTIHVLGFIAGASFIKDEEKKQGSWVLSFSAAVWFIAAELAK
jgi:hypothetical protein